MAREFKFQDPGEGIREAEVLEVFVSAGDRVEEGQDVLLVETDKADFEVSVAFSGTVEAVRVGPGDTVRVGDVLMTVDTGAEESAPEPEPKEEEPEPAAEEPEGERPRAAEPASRREPESAAEEAPAGKAERARRPRAEAPGRAPAGDSHARRGDGPVPASPATRRVARELGVDLREVKPSGAGGRVLTGDVRAHAEGGPRPEEPAAPGERPAAEPAPLELPDFARWGPVEREPLRAVRRTIARRMAEAWRRIPHVTHNDLADITELEAFRRRQAPEIEERGGKLTLTVLVMKAVVAALQAYPRFNASLDPEREELVYKRYHHLGVAIDTDRGLLVPVVRDVDRKSLGELAVELSELAERVRAGEASPEDLAGGTFTITNVGPLGGTHFTPIINHPQVAILGVGRAELRPVVQGTLERPDVGARLLLPLSLGFDHRVNDGADAARFANKVIEVLGDLEAFALHT